MLFLDEPPEFGMRVRDVLRQSIEDKAVTISRAKEYGLETLKSFVNKVESG